MESSVGGIVNKFKMRSRRDVLVFDDILVEYIKRCEKAGYKKDMEEIGFYWGSLTIQAFLPRALRVIPVSVIANTIGMTVWRNIGLLDYMKVVQKNGMATLETRNEYITRTIGKNSFIIGKYAAILSFLSARNVELLKSKQTTKDSIYVFKVKKERRTDVRSKGKRRYDQLNQKKIDIEYTLKDFLKRRIFQIQNNKLFFREQSMLSLENTLFCIISNRAVMLDEVCEISYDFFKKVIKSEKIEEHVSFLKKLMQVMGWGRFKIIIQSQNKIKFEIENAPCGLQEEPDNWDFLVFMILGYLRVFDKKFHLSEKNFGKKICLQFRY
ncbi:MAG: hypothetical protein KAJ91_01265 [Candidatus Aenigmarchaeota archaeon]|nr:hypothetical protein [Candidatus Aenigmarchaeota archaeon]